MEHEARVAGVRLIAAFKLAKAIVLLVLGVATLTLVDKDVTDVMTTWVKHLHVDPDGRLVQQALDRGARLSPGRMRAIAAGTFFYSGLLTVEGVGLLLGKRWAQYFTVVATGSLVPLEIYEIVRHSTITRIAALVVNLAIVAYLVARLRRGR